MAETDREVLQDDQNFRLEKLLWHGSNAVKKTTKDTTPTSRVQRLKNDVYGMAFFAGLVQKHPALNLYIPKVYESSDTFYVREYIADDAVVTEVMGPEEAAPRLDVLAKLLAAVDRLEPESQAGYVGSSNYRNLHQSISKWADENLEASIINDSQAKRVKEISANLGDFIKPRIAHGDMSPYKHSYLRPDGKVALIDYENFTSEAARYFDVAWGYTRLYSFAASTEVPKRFLASFLAQADRPLNQTEQLMAVLIQRTLGMQFDAHADLKSKKIDYRPRAKELLVLVLENKLELLHS